MAIRGHGLWRSSLPHEDLGLAWESLGLGPGPGPGEGTQTEGPLEDAARYLAGYFEGTPGAPELELDLADRPDFSRRVLRACAAIPFGQTRSYSDLARRAGIPGAARAVGQVMRRNPLPLFIPCHRVVGSGGELTGFGGGLAEKAGLLTLEGHKVYQDTAGKWRLAG